MILEAVLRGSGAGFNQSLQYFDPRLTTSEYSTAARAAIVTHYSDLIITDVTDNGGGSYTATGGTLASLLNGNINYANRNSSLSVGQAETVVAPLADNILSCYFPSQITLNVVTQIELTSNFTITVTKANVVFSMGTLYNTNTGAFRWVDADPAPNVANIQNLLVAGHNCRLSLNRSSIPGGEKFEIGASDLLENTGGNNAIAMGRFYVPARQSWESARHQYPSRIGLYSNDAILTFPSSLQGLENWLSSYYNSCYPDDPYQSWQGTVAGVCRCGSRRWYEDEIAPLS